MRTPILQNSAIYFAEIGVNNEIIVFSTESPQFQFFFLVLIPMFVQFSIKSPRLNKVTVTCHIGTVFSKVCFVK